MRFRSKVDAWLIVPVGIGIAVPAVMGVVRVLAGRVGLGTSVVLIAISLALAWLCVVSYTITDDTIIVKRGPIRSQMPLSRLRTLRGTREAIAAPALSLDRIEIRTDKGLWLLVSPADRPGFIRAIQERVPSIELEKI
ncbi:MAG: PH domain-containing protein [Acidobacteria bacterium]|nr:PH domain-containing protein [Acidobacteriota bacterium]